MKRARRRTRRFLADSTLAHARSAPEWLWLITIALDKGMEPLPVVPKPATTPFPLFRHRALRQSWFFRLLFGENGWAGALSIHQLSCCSSHSLASRQLSLHAVCDPRPPSQTSQN